jgi:LuxR family maltose regulon positive regulatory protein
MMAMSTYADVYDFDIYWSKASEYFDKSLCNVKRSFRLPVNSWVSLVGTDRAGAQEEYIAALSRSVPFSLNVTNGVLFGFDDLAWGELLFYQGEFDNAEQYLRKSIDKSRTYDQCSIQIMALIYLMHIAFYRGSYAAASEFMREVEELRGKKNQCVGDTLYDIAWGCFYLELRQPQQIAEWIKGDFVPCSHPAFLDNYVNRVKMQYHHQTRQYGSLLAFIETELQHNTILFGQIELIVQKALIYYKVKKRSEAIELFMEAYHLALPNKIILPFIRYAKDMRTFSVAVLRENVSPAMRIWLENIGRKASTYAKRKTKVIAEYKLANHINDTLSLSNREMDILKDLSQGLSRKEVALSQNISINTVKMTINIIYDKLHVNGLAEAIRVAVDKKLI